MNKTPEHLLVYRRKQYQLNKEKEKAYAKQYTKDHPTYGKEYNKSHIKERKEIQTKCWNDYYTLNKEYRKDYMIKYRSVPEHKERAIELVNKRRMLSHETPINKRYDGSEGHHLNKSEVVFISKELHRSIAHNVFTDKGMAEINHLALLEVFGGEC